MDNQPQPWWVSQGTLDLAGTIHDLPRQPKMFLPKFDLNKVASLINHFKNFYLALWLMNIEHEDMVSRFFTYAFENKA